MERALATRPDRAYARYIVDGLRNGFRIGFQRRAPLKSASCNMPSAWKHTEVVSDYLDKERSLNRMLGPFSATEALVWVHPEGP